MASSSKSQSISAVRGDGLGTPVPDSWLQRLRAGEPQAFEAVFHRYYEALYNFARLYVHSRETAEELVQDVFCRLWERRATLPASASAPASGPQHEADVVRAYLYRSVRNAAVSWLRHQKVERQLRLSAAADLQPPGMGTGPGAADAAVHAADLHARLRHAVAALPEPHRRVLLLRWEHHLSYPEIAAVLSIPLKTVESRVTRAFRALRQALEGLQ